MGSGVSSSHVAQQPLTGSETNAELASLLARGCDEAAEALLAMDRVDLSGCRLGVAGAEALGRALGKEGCFARELKLRGCDVDARGRGNHLKGFCAGLAANTTLEALDLSDNMLGDYAGENVANCVEISHGRGNFSGPFLDARRGSAVETALRNGTAPKL